MCLDFRFWRNRLAAMGPATPNRRYERRGEPNYMYLSILRAQIHTVCWSTLEGVIRSDNQDGLIVLRNSACNHRRCLEKINDLLGDQSRVIGRMPVSSQIVECVIQFLLSALNSDLNSESLTNSVFAHWKWRHNIGRINLLFVLHFPACVHYPPD